MKQSTSIKILTLLMALSIPAAAMAQTATPYETGLSPINNPLPSVPVIPQTNADIPVTNGYQLNTPTYNSSVLLQQALDQLNSAEIDVKKQYSDVRSQYNQVDLQYKRVKLERSQLRSYLRQINHKIKSIQKTKKATQLNMKIR